MNRAITGLLASLALALWATPGVFAAAPEEKAEEWNALKVQAKTLYFRQSDAAKRVACPDDAKATCVALFELKNENRKSSTGAHHFLSQPTDFTMYILPQTIQVKSQGKVALAADKKKLRIPHIAQVDPGLKALPKGQAVMVIVTPVGAAAAATPAAPVAPTEPALGAYENSVLDSLADADRKKYETDGCLKQEPADGPGADKRRKSCRTAIGLALESYGKSKPDAAKLGDFETAYIEKRLGPGAAKFRRLIAKSGKGKKPEEAVKAWRSTLLDEHTEYTAAAADKRPAHDPKKLSALLDAQLAKEFPLAAAIELVFKDDPPAVRAMVEHIVTDSLATHDEKAILKAADEIRAGRALPKDMAASIDKRRQEVAPRIKKELEKPQLDPKLAALLAENGVSEEALLAYYCPIRPMPQAAGPKSSNRALAQLQKANQRGQNAAQAADEEEAKGGAAVEAGASSGGGRIEQRCGQQKYAAALASNQSAAAGKKGSEVEPPQPIGKDAGGKKEEKEDPNKNVNMIGGAKMGVWSGLVASFLGGPVGWAMLLGVGGLALGTWMTKDINR